MSAQAEIEKRKADLSMSMYAVVKAKDENGPWKEVADVISVSATGAGFYIQRDCQVGTLVSLTLAMPAHQRCYDHDKELYKVWGLVQHCHKITSDEIDNYHIGVAFIGKNTPESFQENPLQNYRICGMNEDGLWKIAEAKTNFKTRKHARFRKSVDHYLAVLDARQRTIGGERTVTENISKSGAAVYTTLDVGVGDRVKFICEQYDFSGLAVVCNKHATEDDRVKLHLQFVDTQFPVELVNLPEAIIEQAA